ncbi:TlpA family protein disulfide reductase [candidate division KSB1 bacterium]|nr:MAG: TlpA family protein disulfide reductase [candidate division KSB1 bacterium]
MKKYRITGEGKKMTRFVALALALLMLVSIGCGQSKKATPKNANKLEFTVQDVNEKTVDMRQYLGKVVIIDFWDTWCGPCRREIPHFNDLYAEYGSKGLVIVGVAFARQGKDAVKQFTTSQPIKYVSTLFNEEAQKQFGSPTGIPTTYIIDQQGNIVEKAVGYRDKAFFEQKIKSLLKIS